MAEKEKDNKKEPAKKEKKSLLSSLLPGGGGGGGEKEPAKAGVSTQKFLKISGIREGILELEDGSYKTIIMASSVNFALMAKEEQEGMLYGYQDFLNSLEFPIQILVQSRILNIKSYLEKLSDIEKMQENQLLRIQIAEYKKYIQSLIELANITTNQFYVVVNYTGGPGASKTSPVEGILKAINPARGAKIKLESFDKAKRELYQRANSVIGGLRGMGIRAAQLNTQEIVELFYSNYNPELAGTEILADLGRLNIETD